MNVVANRSRSASSFRASFFVIFTRQVGGGVRRRLFVLVRGTPPGWLARSWGEVSPESWPEEFCTE
jgi:hypothetical protein